MTAQDTQIPEDIMQSAREVASLVTGCGCDDCQTESANTIAKAILAERQRDQWQRDQWQPIETAPEKREVFVWYDDGEDSFADTAYRVTNGDLSEWYGSRTHTVYRNDTIKAWMEIVEPKGGEA